MASSITAYQTVVRDFAKSLALRASDRVNQREIDHFKERIGKIKSVEDFVADRRVFAFAMKAHGLEDMTYARAFIKKMLVEGIDDRGALANKLVDPRYKAFVKAFNFARHGALATTFDSAQSGTVEKYTRVALEQSVGATSEAARLALYFERMAPSITSTFVVLGDPALAKVVRTAVGLSDATAGLDIDKQAALIAGKLDIEKLSEPAYLKKFINRFLNRWDAANGAPAPAATPLAAAGGGALGVDVLMSLQQTRLGRR